MAANVNSHPVTGLRERKKARTRAALVASAQRLFAERGYATTTVEDVALAAEVSPRTFFRYFATKEEVLFAEYEAAIDLWLEEMRAAPAGEQLGAAMRNATLALTGLYERDPQRFDALDAVLAAEPALAGHVLELDGRAAERAAALIAERLGIDADADPRPRIIAGATMGAVRAATRTWALGHRSATRARYVHQAFDRLERLGEDLRTRLG
jgi:AcrR family transcriptional regulator